MYDEDLQTFPLGSDGDVGQLVEGALKVTDGPMIEARLQTALIPREIPALQVAELRSITVDMR